VTAGHGHFQNFERGSQYRFNVQAGMRRGRFHHRSQQVLAPGMLDGAGQLARLAAGAQFGANVEPFHTASNLLPNLNFQLPKGGEASGQPRKVDR
jgi:hypothetical protein